VANCADCKRGAAMGNEWYVLRNGEKYGPFTSDRMSAGVRDGELTSQDLVWCEGMPDWQPAGEVLPSFRATKDARLAREDSMALRKKPNTEPLKATSGKAAPKQLNAADMQKQEVASARLLFRLGEVLSVFMRAPQFRAVALGDIQRLVVPPMSAGQFLVAEARSKTQGIITPVAAALWAKVSKEVDRRLSESLDKPARLDPGEWKSGEIAWLVAVAGYPQALTPMLKKLQETNLKGQPIKMRAKGKDGKTIVTTLRTNPADPARG
jgi:cytolysin-activating lysine-acyltransferase